MWKHRGAALALAAVTVAVVATPAAEAKSVSRFRGLEMTAYVNDWPPGAVPGTKGVAWVVYASQFRVRDDGTVTLFGGTLSLIKYRVRVTPHGYETIFVGDGTVDSTAIQVAQDLSSASVSGSVGLERCNRHGTGCATSDVTVSANLAASAPVTFQKGRVVNKVTGCRTIDRFNYRNRAATSGAVIDGETSGSSVVEQSTIGFSESTTITRGTGC